MQTTAGTLLPTPTSINNMKHVWLIDSRVLPVAAEWRHPRGDVRPAFCITLGAWGGAVLNDVASLPPLDPARCLWSWQRRSPRPGAQRSLAWLSLTRHHGGGRGHEQIASLRGPVAERGSSLAAARRRNDACTEGEVSDSHPEALPERNGPRSCRSLRRLG